MIEFMPFHRSSNVRALQDSDSALERKTTSVSLELKYTTDIAVLSETRVDGSSQLEEMQGDYSFFWSDKSANEARQPSVGFAI